MNKAIGRRIAAAREMRGISAKTLAQRLSIKPTRLSNWETGFSGVSAENIYKISKELNVTSDYLIGLTDSPDAIYENSEDSQTRGKLIAMYSQLNSMAQGKVADYASDLRKIKEYDRKQELSEVEIVEEPRTYQHAAYGTDLSKKPEEVIEDIDRQVKERTDHPKKLD